MFNRAEKPTSGGSPYGGIPRYGSQPESNNSGVDGGFKKLIKNADSADVVIAAGIFLLVSLVVFMILYYNLHKNDGNPARAEAVSSMCSANPTQYRVFTEEAFESVHMVGRQFVVGYKNKGDEWVPVSTETLVESSGPVLPTPTSEGSPKGTKEVTCNG